MQFLLASFYFPEPPCSANPPGLPLAKDSDAGGCAWLLMSLGRVLCFLILIVFCHVEKLVTILFYGVIISSESHVTPSRTKSPWPHARWGGVSGWLSFKCTDPFFGKSCRMQEIMMQRATTLKHHAKTLPGQEITGSRCRRLMGCLGARQAEVPLSHPLATGAGPTDFSGFFFPWFFSSLLRLDVSHQKSEVWLQCPIFRKRAASFRALLRKMTYENKASYVSTPTRIYCHTHPDGDRYIGRLVISRNFGNFLKFLPCGLFLKQSRKEQGTIIIYAKKDLHTYMWRICRSLLTYT